MNLPRLRPISAWAALAAAAIALLAHSSRTEPASAGSARAPALVAPPNPALTAAAPPQPLVEVGRSLFFDASLSEPPGTSCASCHEPGRAFSGDNGSGVGVARGSRAGRLARRTAPSLLYLKYFPKFHYFQDDDAARPAPFGGLFWDGRVDTIADLVKQPLLNPNEMNGGSARVVAGKVKQAPYADQFRTALGTNLDDTESVFAGVGKAIEAFLTSSEMAPFSSKFDAFVTGRGKLSTFEREGMRLFEDPGKGGCIGCHRFYETGRDPALSMFTDFGYDALGVPRNDKLAPGRKADLGLCERTDKQTPSSDRSYCGNFRTPSLRNVAVLGAFMHNGSFTSLREVVSFYATRATDPKRWYKSGTKFDDLPPAYRGQVNAVSVPYNRREGDVPALSERDIDAIVAFLETLTDAPHQKRATP